MLTCYVCGEFSVPAPVDVMGSAMMAEHINEHVRKGEVCIT